MHAFPYTAQFTVEFNCFCL